MLEIPQTLLFIMAVLFMGSPLIGAVIFAVITSMKKD